VARWDGSYELDIMTDERSQLVVRNPGGGIGSGFSPSTISRARWHHFVGIFSGGVATLWIDGVKGADLNLGGVLQNAGPVPDRVMIGATRDGSNASSTSRG